MKKQLVLPIRIEEIHYPGQVAIEILIDSVSLQEWCLGLCLLKEGLMESFAVREASGTRGIEINIVPQDKNDPSLLLGLSKTIRAGVTLNSLEYVQYFFLKYYRDGVAEVDHLDLEGVLASEEHEEVYLTFKVPDSAPPISEEELKRRLELE
jgi:hypothetical protein